MNPNIVCLTDTIKVLSFYGVVAYAIHSARVVIIAFINRRAELLDLFSPRTPEEVTIDHARRIGMPDPEVETEDVSILEFPSEKDEVKH
jgi:hypothetical protein